MEQSNSAKKKRYPKILKLVENFNLVRVIDWGDWPDRRIPRTEQERGARISHVLLARVLGDKTEDKKQQDEKYAQLRNGERDLTDKEAENLSKTFGNTTEFWKERQRDYRRQIEDALKAFPSGNPPPRPR